MDLLAVEQPADEARQPGLGLELIGDAARGRHHLAPLQHCTTGGTLEVTPQHWHPRCPVLAVMRVHDVVGELLGLCSHMPAVAPTERVGPHLVAAPQDRVLAGATLLLLLECQFVLGQCEKRFALEPVDRRRHIPVDLHSLGDQTALVVLSGERQQHARLDHREVPGAKLRPISGHQRVPQLRSVRPTAAARQDRRS